MTPHPMIRISKMRALQFLYEDVLDSYYAYARYIAILRMG